MKAAILAMLLPLLASAALAEETNSPTPASAASNALPATITIDGIIYSNVTWRTITAATVTIFHSTGIATIPLEKLPPDLQKRFGYDPQKAADWQAAQQKAAAEAARKKAQRIAEQQALEKKWAAALWRVGTVDRILPDGIIVVLHFGGHMQRENPYQSPAYVEPQDVYILLVGHPKKTEFAEGNTIGCYAYKDGVVTVDGDTLEKWVYCEAPSVKK